MTTAHAFARAVSMAFEPLYAATGVRPTPGTVKLHIHPETRADILTDPEHAPWHDATLGNPYGFDVVTDLSVPPGEVKCVIHHEVHVAVQP